MENSISVEIRSKKVYNYGILYSGYRIFDHFLVKNLTDAQFEQLNVSIRSNPDFFSGDTEISYLQPNGIKTLSPDFLTVDENKIKNVKLPTNVLYVFEITNSDGETVCYCEKTVLINPYNYFSGFYDAPESLAALITPEQDVIQKICDSISNSDPKLTFEVIYRLIKSEKLTFCQENYFEYSSKKLRLPEEVFVSKSANSLEIAVIVSSVLENLNFHPIIIASPRGKVFVGIKGEDIKNDLPLFMLKNSFFNSSSLIVDAQYFGYGSELEFDVAIYNTLNTIQFSDEKLLLCDIENIRKLHILPLPNRVNDNGAFTPFNDSDYDNSSSFDSYFDILKKYNDDPRVRAILTGQKFHVSSQKYHYDFDNSLDVNQNKILNRVLANDLTLIRTKNGTGVSTLFAKAAKMMIRNKKNVLYLSDKTNDRSDFCRICGDYFSKDFIFDINQNSIQEKADTGFNGIFKQSENSFFYVNNIQDLYKKAENYYSKLEGGKQIVDSFFVAGEKFNQFRSGNDCVVFSPEQMGVLSDPVVKEWFSTINEISSCLSEVKTVFKNPLSYIKCSNFTYEFKSKLFEKLDSISHLIENFQSTKNEVMTFYSVLGDVNSYSSISTFCDILRLFADHDNFSAEFFHDPSKIEENFENITRMIRLKQENKVKLDTVFMAFDESILNLNAEENLKQWQSANGDKSFKAFSIRRSIVKNVKKYLVPNCNFENIELILTNLTEYHKNEDLINNSIESSFKLCSIDPQHEDAWERLRIVSEYCYQIYTVFKSGFDISLISDFANSTAIALKIDSFVEKASAFVSLFDEFEKSKRELDSIVFSELDAYNSGSLALDADYFDMILHSVNEIILSLDGLKAWCNWLTTRRKAVEIGLKNVIMCLENGRLDSSEIKKAFVRAFFKAICEYNFISSPELSPENDIFEEVFSKIEEYSPKAFAAFRNETDAIVSIDKIDAVNSIREQNLTNSDLIVDHVNILNKIYPVISCSISDAKRIFEGKNIKFDYVFIESKSKVRLGDFLWIFSLADHVSFSGNSITPFKSSTNSIDLSKSAFEYLWKLSDEKYNMSCVYKNSASLVGKFAQFLNSTDSETRYYSVPASKIEDSFVFERVRGFYNVDFPNANLQEAEFAISKINEFLASEEKSVSIVTSTSEQCDLVLRLLAKILNEDESKKEMIISGEKSVSIFSVNDQFVSADSVFFLFTFAPDKSVPGARLPFEIISAFSASPDNCLINILSLARKKFSLVASFSPDELEYSTSVLPTVSSIRLLFDLAMCKDSNLSYELCEMPVPNGYITRLQKDLSDNGFKTLLGVKCGRFYIDLAVVDCDGNFLLGVISDSTVLSQSNNIFSVEFANYQSLKKEGWNIFRLLSTKCFDSYERELDKILDILGVDVYNKDIL